jgi:penicillin V acylase-like amidase (Ntn superfamily)
MRYGLSEAGLSANILWLAESEYPVFDQSKPGLSIAAWAQYVLDNFATVEEAVNVLRREPFTIVTDTVPGDTRLATLHLSMSDATGDSAIVEYIGGKQVIHHGRQYHVMTNSPTFEHQLALNAYWKEIGGTVMLPGTNRSADRFAREEDVHTATASRVYGLDREKLETKHRTVAKMENYGLA